MNVNIRIIIYSFIVLTACTSDDDIVQYFEYPDHNVLNIGSQLADLYITNDSNTLIAADKGNNRVLFIDVSSDEMHIKNTVWVGSEPTSLDMTDDGRYLFVGLLGGSSVSIINMETMTLEGRLNLKQSSVFDIEYLSNKCQLIVSFKSSNKNDNNTYIHAWWADENGEWYGSNTSCSYADDSSVLTVSDYNIAISPSDHDEGMHKNVIFSGSTGTGAVANIKVNALQYIESIDILYGGEDYTTGDTLTIPAIPDPEIDGSDGIGGSDGKCIITETFNNPIIKISESGFKEVDPPQIYSLVLSSSYNGWKKASEQGTSQVELGGLISTSIDESSLYIVDIPHVPIRIHRYDINEDGMSTPLPEIKSKAISTEGSIDFLHDLKYISGFGVVVAFDGADPVDGVEVNHASVYDIDELIHISNLDVGSVPLAVAYDSVGQHIYISPTDVDDNGMFIVEFSMDTQLQTNYYQVAGLLGSHALIVDPKGEYIYAAVDDLTDQDTHEPYNGSSFNIQKIKIIPEGTYPINDF